MEQVADIMTVSQFEPGESQGECGPFAVALCKFAGAPGKGPRGSAEDIDVWADAAYDKIFGGHDIGKETGVVPAQVQQMLLDAGLHYQDLSISDTSAQADDIAEIKAALNQGYMVLGEVSEVSVNDVELGANPYWWGPSGWHYIVYTGYTDTALIAHDGAKVTGTLNGVNTARPQPRQYSADRIQNRWATIVWTDWLPRMPSGWDPRKQVINTVVTQQSLYDKLVALEKAYNYVVDEKNGLIGVRDQLTAQLATAQGDMQKLQAAYDSLKSSQPQGPSPDVKATVQSAITLLQKLL